MTGYWRLKLAVVLLAGGLLPVAADAAPGWSTPMTVQSVIPTDSALKVVVTSSSNQQGCTSPTWLTLNTSDLNFDLISAAILTAFNQGKAVKVWETGCVTDGSVHFIAAWVDR